MSLNADRAGKLLLGFPTTCKDHPRTLGSHPLRLSDEEMSSVTRPSGTITAGRAARWSHGTGPGCLHHCAGLSDRKVPDFPQPVFTMVVLFAAAQEKKSHTFVLPGTGSSSARRSFIADKALGLFIFHTTQQVRSDLTDRPGCRQNGTGADG